VNDEQLGVKIMFDSRSSAEANRAASELRKMLLDNVDDRIAASIEKTDDDTQDTGSVLVLLFGTSAAIAIAEGIRAYLAKRPEQRDHIMIKTADGNEIVATGEAASKLDAPALIKALQARRRSL
jgi:hypothetical protein